MIERPDWEKLLAAERHLQVLIPGSTLVGGTAAAIHAHHLSIRGRFGARIVARVALDVNGSQDEEPVR